MPVPLERWDKEVAPYLQEIEWRATRIRRDVTAALAACHALTIRPGFESKAKDEITNTIRVLEEALAGMQAAAAIYDGKSLDA